MLLDRFTSQRLDVLRKEYAHVSRRYREISLVSTLCVAFDAFNQMQLNRISAESDITYQEAENTADALGEVFGMEIPASAFLPDEKRIDKAIEFYKKYKSMSELIVYYGYEQEDLDAFCKQIFYDPWKYKLGTFKTFVSTGYMYNMIAACDYVYGRISAEQLNKAMFKFIPPSLLPMDKDDIRCLIKTMIRALWVFEDIAEKRKTRRRKAK